MSRLPKVENKPKNNKSTKFRWVDSQWEKFMNRHDEDLKIIDQLREDLITCNKFFQNLKKESALIAEEKVDLHLAVSTHLSVIHKQREDMLKLEMENAELKDMVLDLGGEYKEDSNWEITNDTGNGDFEVKRPMIYESPDGGETVYGRRAGDDKKKLVTNPNQMELFED